MTSFTSTPSWAITNNWWLDSWFNHWWLDCWFNHWWLDCWFNHWWLDSWFNHWWLDCWFNHWWLDCWFNHWWLDSWTLGLEGCNLVLVDLQDITVLFHFRRTFALLSTTLHGYFDSAIPALLLTLRIIRTNFWASSPGRPFMPFAIDRAAASIALLCPFGISQITVSSVVPLFPFDFSGLVLETVPAGDDLVGFVPIIVLAVAIVVLDLCLFSIYFIQVLFNFAL